MGEMDDAEDSLIVHAGPSGHFTPQPGSSSRSTSRPTSRPLSRGTSGEYVQLPAKARWSDDLEHQERPGRSSRSSHVDGGDDIVFKAPGEEDEDLVEHSTSAPLLSNGRVVDVSEIEELELAEGPNSVIRGTLLESIANMANSIMGAGIVGLPYAVSQAGFISGTALLIALAATTDWTIRLVVLNAKLSGRDSYTDVMHHCFGHAGAAAVSFFQFAFAFGGMCDSIPHVISYIFPSLASHAILGLLVNRNAIIVLVTITVSFPLSLHRDIVKLSKSSGFALISMTIIVSSVVFRSVAIDSSLRGSSSHIFTLIRPGVLDTIGVISFAFVCHHNTMFIYQSIETPTLDRFNAVTHASTGMSLLCCLLMSVTGYVTFTDKTQGNILNNFSTDDLIINIARFCFGANMSTTIPLENYVCREVVEDFFFKDKLFSQRRHVIITSVIVFSTMLISLTTCDLGVVLEVVGGLSATALAFIFPAAAYFTLINGPWYSRQKLPSVLCASFGVIVLALSCGSTIAKVWSGEHSAKVCS